jgi:DGQHR domain-containing protein
MAKIRRYKTKTLRTKFGNLTVYNLTMKVKDVLHISYVAVRGKDDEEGAVQRLLNRKRIQSIKSFILEGNMFFNTFILNWTNTDLLPKYGDDLMEIPIIPSAAQIIDGQHRLEGLKEAIKDDDKIGEQEILVSLCLGLSTKEAALIFVNINSEQKPVPKSLIYDLFGEIDDNQDHAINRANDIAEELNENLESPFYGAIKFPGTPRGVGIVDLSAIVNSLKKHLEPTGIFANYNLTNLQNQKLVILNYFTAIKYYYDRANFWDDKAKNPFLSNAGFIGAIEHLITRLLAKCAEKKSFKVEDFRSLLDLPKDDLLQRSDLKGLGGTAQRKVITDFLEKNLLKSLPEQDEYKF